MSEHAIRDLLPPEVAARMEAEIKTLPEHKPPPAQPPIPHRFYADAIHTQRCIYCNKVADDCEGEAVCEAAERIRKFANEHPDDEVEDDPLLRGLQRAARKFRRVYGDGDAP